MPATKRLVLDLPADQVEEIESVIKAGSYASASEVVTTALDAWRRDEGPPGDLLPPVDERSPHFQAFLKECEEVFRRVDAGLEPTYSSEEVRAYLEERSEDRLRHRAQT